MAISPELLGIYSMNDDQRAIVSHKKGPLLVIAGPGSGKTHSLTLLAMNLLLCSDAKPSELVLCTYTEKAAYEMRDRIAHIAKEVNYKEDLSQLRVGTIHSICNQFITEHLHHTPLGHNYETLDQLPQQLLIFEYIDEICKEHTRVFFEERWGTRWKVAQRLQSFFDKIVEELIFDDLKKVFPYLKPYPSERDTFVCYLTHAYSAYQKILAHINRIDFAHLQKCAYNLLRDPEIFHRITKSIRYILVDEYQDTNYIQEQIIIMLASATGSNNLCVVGDEDQALYRFRGATVRNILEFANKFPGCIQRYLTTNYRSHPKIISLYNHWMTSTDWSNSDGTSFRTNKTIRSIPDKSYAEYPAVLSILDVEASGEAEQFAELVYSLKEQGKISDYNQVALLLTSVRTYLSDTYIEALKKRGIPAFCPRARTFFLQEEVRLIVGCFAQIFSYQAEKRNNFVGHDHLSEYISNCLTQLTYQCQLSPELDQKLLDIELEIVSLEEEQEQRKQPADYFYQLIATEPFATFLKKESQMQNLVIFSQLLKTFQNYYRYSTITQDNLKQLQSDFFHRFLRLLHEDGINQYENPQQPYPEGHVQIMTIHQAKGLEFPVIVVGRLDKTPPSSDNEDRDLQRFYRRPHFEPDKCIPAFDLKRLYYVAFSRAESLLVLTANKKPHAHFSSIWNGLPMWPYANVEWSDMPTQTKPKEYILPKPRYSFTGHIQMYETCPRQFQFFREYNFMPSHPVEAFFGLLVHQTIEKIHRKVLDGDLDTLKEDLVQKIFSETFYFLKRTYITLLDDSQKEKGFNQVLNYIRHNQEEMSRVEATEVPVSVENDDYILTGKIDLLMRYNGGLEVLDFKTTTRPDKDSDRLMFYEKQLYIYAHALERRTGKLPERLLLYWMGEECKEDALMVVPCKRELVKQANLYFDDIVTKIKQQQFNVTIPPEPRICRTCDIRSLCLKEKVIQLF